MVRARPGHVEASTGGNGDPARTPKQTPPQTSCCLAEPDTATSVSSSGSSSTVEPNFVHVFPSLVCFHGRISASDALKLC